MEKSELEAALDIALRQQPPPSHLLHHSDQGSQYTSASYQAQLSILNPLISMSRVVTPYDNAPVGSFFASHAEARAAIFEFIEGRPVSLLLL